ncbi:CU044_2847 family protein [Saccharopolyspora kobensis]|nr:CU044_2847 family protein [Saccharopolyspora kobensis]
MDGLARMRLDDGGEILIETTPEPGGPVKAGRDGVHELPNALNTSLASVRETARAVLDELREAGSDEVEVEFSVDLSARAGAVITQGKASGT